MSFAALSSGEAWSTCQPRSESAPQAGNPPMSLVQSEGGAGRRSPRCALVGSLRRAPLGWGPPSCECLAGLAAPTTLSNTVWQQQLHSAALSGRPVSTGEWIPAVGMPLLYQQFTPHVKGISKPTSRSDQQRAPCNIQSSDHRAPCTMHRALITEQRALFTCRESGFAAVWGLQISSRLSDWKTVQCEAAVSSDSARRAPKQSNCK